MVWCNSSTRQVLCHPPRIAHAYRDGGTNKTTAMLARSQSLFLGYHGSVYQFTHAIRTLTALPITRIIHPHEIASATFAPAPPPFCKTIRKSMTAHLCLNACRRMPTNFLSCENRAARAVGHRELGVHSTKYQKMDHPLEQNRADRFW